MAVYKDHLFAAECRLAQLASDQRCDRIPAPLLTIYARRQARLWASVVGIVGFVLLGLETLGGGGYPTHILLLTWMAMVPVYLITRVVARSSLSRFARRRGRASGDVVLDLARLEAGEPHRSVVERVRRLERSSFAFPLAAITLLTPLTLHCLFSLAVLQVQLKEFNAWIVISMVIVGHAHLTLLVLALVHVARMRTEMDRGEPAQGAPRGIRAVVWATLASTIPGIFLLCIPPPLVFLTGVIFVPAVFAWSTHQARRERASLKEAAES